MSNIQNFVHIQYAMRGSIVPKNVQKQSGKTPLPMFRCNFVRRILNMAMEKPCKTYTGRERLPIYSQTSDSWISMDTVTIKIQPAIARKKAISSVCSVLPLNVRIFPVNRIVPLNNAINIGFLFLMPMMICGKYTPARKKQYVFQKLAVTSVRNGRTKKHIIASIIWRYFPPPGIWYKNLNNLHYHQGV